jgi:hypothetical protein
VKDLEDLLNRQYLFDSYRNPGIFSGRKKWRYDQIRRKTLHYFFTGVKEYDTYRIWFLPQKSAVPMVGHMREDSGRIEGGKVKNLEC